MLLVFFVSMPSEMHARVPRVRDFPEVTAGVQAGTPSRVRIDIWSDVVCPWCYLGKRNLERALETFAHGDDIEIVWRSYELDPHAPQERSGTYTERIARKYGLPVGHARDRMARIVALGADAGIDFRFDDVRAGNTFDAHRLLHLAAEQGLQHALKGRMFHALFTEGVPIGDRTTMVSLAADVGIAEDDARATLESGAYGNDVRADETTAVEMGITGVPFFVVDGRFGVPGAQAPDVMLRVLDRAWEKAG
jgi:predicted DsbA family dithiol-disulfide isomerase